MNNLKTTILEQNPEVNNFARRTRHLKVFSKLTLVKLHGLGALKWVFSPIRKFLHNRYFSAVYRLFDGIFSAVSRALSGVSPQKKMIIEATSLAFVLFIGSSFSIGATVAPLDMNYSDEYIYEYSVPGDVLVADENGYLIKINPQTDKANRIGMTDYAIHTVESGDSLSVIAEKYSVTVDTIMWENKIGNANTLRVGQKLMIPPISGISYAVASGDTLEKIAKKFNITKEVIIAQNGLADEALIKGKNLFLPGAKPIVPVNTIASNYQAKSVGGSRSYTSVSRSDATPVAGKSLIYPTRGSITQYFRSGHYAVDIADSSRPAVWAASGGTVIKASSGTWGGGYGNHIIIDHGDGMKTLYAHLDSLNVYEGQVVGQGDVIGIMGNTGRVYGRTGIHLHFEVIDNGVKRNPLSYF